MADPRLPPKCAGRFVLERLLGTGAFGTVCLARQIELDRPVALKLVRTQGVPTAQDKDRLLVEARITSRLEHPNIVRVFDCDIEEDVAWIAYEYLEGETLAQMAARGPLPPAQAVDMAMQIARALEAAHARDVLHRDIKPANVLKLGDGTCKVIDFGIAKCAGPQAIETAAGLIFGTVEYMAPEYIQGRPYAPSCDLYSLAVSLFELLTGRRPFEASRPLDVLQLHLESPPPHPGALVGTVSASLDRFVTRALSKDPQERHSTAREFLEHLEIVRQPVVAPAGSGPARPAGAGERGRTARVTRPALQARRTVPGTQQVSSTASPPGRVVALVGAAAVLTMIVGAGVVVQRAPPASSPSASPAAAAGTLPFRFPAGGRRLEVMLEAAATSGSYLRLRDIGRSSVTTLSCDSSRVVTFERLLSSTSYELALVPSGTGPATRSTTVSTPERLEVFNVGCYPSAREVLVDFDFESRWAFDVELVAVATSRKALSIPCDPDRRFFRHRFQGLSPDTEYTLRVLPRKGWGGLKGLAFKTETAAQGSAVRQRLNEARSFPLGLLVDGLMARPDPQMEEPLAEAVEKGEFEALEAADALPELIFCLRSPRLAEAVLKKVGTRLGRLDWDRRAYLVAAASMARHRQALDLARTELAELVRSGVALKEATFYRVAQGLAATREPRAFRWIQTLMENQPRPGQVLHWMLRCDRIEGAAVCRRWAGGADGALREVGLVGLGILGDPRDVPLLETASRTAGDRSTRQAALQALRLHGSGAARAAATQFARDNLSNPDAIWTAAMLEERRLPAWIRRNSSMLTDDSLSVLTSTSAELVLAREVSALAQGTLGTGDPESLRFLRSRLESLEPRVQRASVWALGRLGDRSSGPAIARRFLESDPGPTTVAAVWAAGQLRERSAVGGLRSLIEKGHRSGDREGQMGAALAAWALARIGLDGTDRALLERIARSSGASDLVRRFAKLALGSDPASREGEVELFVFPFLPAVATGIETWPEEIIEVSARGAWTLSGAARPPAELTEILPLREATALSLLAQIGEANIPVSDAPRLMTTRQFPLRDGRFEVIVSPFYQSLPIVRCQDPGEAGGFAMVRVRRQP
ncbi:MAG: protein kinase [Candidatus Riflebacteria bacterium]|nr:protein kinase [Candidatus Riflebacteria bacterium]